MLKPKIYYEQSNLLGCWYEFNKITGCEIKINNRVYSNDKPAEKQIKKATFYSMRDLEIKYLRINGTNVKTLHSCKIIILVKDII